MPFPPVLHLVSTGPRRGVAARSRTETGSEARDAWVVVVARFRAEQRAEGGEPAGGLALDGARLPAEHLGGLLNAQPLVVPQDQHGALAGGHPGECGADPEPL